MSFIPEKDSAHHAIASSISAFQNFLVNTGRSSGKVSTTKKNFPAVFAEKLKTSDQYWMLGPVHPFCDNTWFPFDVFQFVRYYHIHLTGGGACLAT